MSTLTLRTSSVQGHAAAALQPAHYPAPITLNRTLSLRAALFALLVFAGLLAGLNLVSHLLLAPGTPPVDLRANIAFYADCGYPIQFCETGRAGGYSGAVTPHCNNLPDPKSPFGSDELLGEGDYLSIALGAEALRFDQLVARWGMPRLTREVQGGLGLAWDLPTLQAAASLTWGEPHRTPQQAILTLKHVGTAGAPA